MKLKELGRQERYKLVYPVFMIMSRDPRYFNDEEAWRFMRLWGDDDLDTLYDVLDEIYQMGKRYEKTYPEKKPRFQNSRW